MPSERIYRLRDRLHDQAEEVLVQRNWNLVRKSAQDVQRLDPENTDGLAVIAAAERYVVNIPTPVTPASQPGAASVAPEPDRPHPLPSPSVATRCGVSWAQAARSKFTWPVIPQSIGTSPPRLSRSRA